MTSAYENYTSASSFANHYGSYGNGNDQVNGYLNYYHNFPTSSMMNPQACPYNYYSEYSTNLFSTSKPQLQLPSSTTTTTASTQSSHYHYDVEYNNQNYYYNNNKAKVPTYWNQFNTKMAINYQMQQQQQQQVHQEYPAAYAKDSNYSILSGDNKAQFNISASDQFTAECNQILNDRKLFGEQSRECEKVWTANERAVASEEVIKQSCNEKYTDSPALRALLTNPESKFKQDVNYFYKQFRKKEQSKNFNETLTTPPLSPGHFTRLDEIDSAESPLSHDWMNEGSGKYLFA